MFTGIIEAVGKITSIVPDGAGVKLRVDASAFGGDVALGDSIGVNGVCLTIETIDGVQLEFRATRETLDKTNLGKFSTGDRVNLERALSYGDRIGGHLVTGHVDGIGRVTRIHKAPNDWIISFEVPPELGWALVPKGSIAVDGISLTLVDPGALTFSVAIVQFTLDHTTLGDRAPGDPVHIEGDVMGRWVAHLLRGHGSGSDAPLDWERIRELGDFGSAPHQSDRSGS